MLIPKYQTSSIWNLPRFGSNCSETLFEDMIFFGGGAPPPHTPCIFFSCGLLPPDPRRSLLDPSTHGVPGTASLGTAASGWSYNATKKRLSPVLSNLNIAITLEPEVVDPYNLGDSWSWDRDLLPGKVVPFSEGGGLLGCEGERGEIWAHNSGI